jgi:hypothetical protein
MGYSGTNGELDEEMDNMKDGHKPGNDVKQPVSSKQPISKIQNGGDQVTMSHRDFLNLDNGNQQRFDRIYALRIHLKETPGQGHGDKKRKTLASCTVLLK